VVSSSGAVCADQSSAVGYPLSAIRYPLSAISHPPSVIGQRAALFFPVDLGPDGEHHIAEDKGIQGDEGDVAAEVEGEHAADEEEEHAAGFLIQWFSQPVSPTELPHGSL
jgi:hypothetical protein